MLQMGGRKLRSHDEFFFRIPFLFANAEKDRNFFMEAGRTHYSQNILSIKSLPNWCKFFKCFFTEVWINKYFLNCKQLVPRGSKLHFNMVKTETQKIGLGQNVVVFKKSTIFALLSGNFIISTILSQWYCLSIYFLDLSSLSKIS